MTASAVAETDKQSLKIIALAPHIVEQLYAIGAGDQVIGTTAYSDYPEAAKSIPVVGSYAGLQVEKILQMQPDLVIAWKTGNPVSDLERLKKYQLPVVYSDIRSLDDVAAELRQFGELTGRQTAAEHQASAYEQALSTLRNRYAGKRPVKVFYELWSRPLTTVAGNAWPQQQLELCGAENPFADSIDDYPHVGLEQVLVSQPQAIIQPSKHSQNSPDAINWQQWPSIPAVKNNAIFHPDADKVHRMTARTLPEIEKLCQQIDGIRH
ncbi:MAG: cobalamin-binding protein [Oceanospirillaceae bacterium]|nr:cobalamin-binding protein [Oceanospirillaceae bacterium]